MKCEVEKAFQTIFGEAPVGPTTKHVHAFLNHLLCVGVSAHEGVARTPRVEALPCLTEAVYTTNGHSAPAPPALWRASNLG